MQPQLQKIVAGIERREVSDLLAGVFSDLNRLLGYLDSIGSATRLGESAGEAAFLLEVIRSEGLATAGGLEYQCATLELPAELSEELERISFAIRYELRTVFERILPASGADADDTLVQAVTGHVRRTRRDVEVNVLDGGQERYPLLVGVV